MALHRAVMVYQSSDGSKHDSVARADQHTKDHLCRTLDKLLAPLTVSGRFTKSDITAVVLALAEGRSEIGTLCKEVAPILNWIIENAEDQGD